jgi:hypothetical protein
VLDMQGSPEKRPLDDILFIRPTSVTLVPLERPQGLQA